MNTPRDPDQTLTRGTSRSGAAPEQPITGTEARQGNTGRPVLMVLIAGLVLAAIAWGGAEWWGESTAPPAEQTATPPAGDNTPVNSTSAPSANPTAEPAPSTSGANPANSN